MSALETVSNQLCLDKMAELPPFFFQELNALKFDEQANASVTGYAQRHMKRMPLLADDAYAGEGHDFPICRLHPLGRLAVVVWKLAEIRRKYEERGTSPEILADTFSDITLRQRLFLQSTGKVGLSRADCVWLRHLANTQIFKLGVLQFQPTGMYYLENHEDGRPFFVISDAQKTRLPAGTQVLNVHIQAGADLSPEHVEVSLRMARDFFAEVFPGTEFRAMICYSWLLHTGLKDLLPVTSRILRFVENFEVVSETGDKRQALERIFGKRYRRKADYPQQSSLQRAALHAPSRLGYALGIIYL